MGMDPQPNIDRNEVLAEAALNAASAIGLSQAQLGQLIGRNRTRLRESIRVDNKAGEYAVLVVRIYRSLYALMDGNPAHMKHWMVTHNHGTRGIPRDQMQTLIGLVEVVNYLDAIRGKV